MSTRAQDDRIGSQISLAQITGNPVYFFDTSFLLENVTALAGWNQARLEAAIAPRVENALNRADVRIASANGFYIVFAGRDPHLARDKANAICTDILRHFYGNRSYLPEDVDRLCRPSSARTLAEELGLAANTQRGIVFKGRGRAPQGDDMRDSEKEKMLFKRELTELFAEHLESAAARGKFQFSACWDSRKECITSFLCTSTNREIPFPVPVPEPVSVGVQAATEQCKHDVMALAAGVKGIRVIAARGDLAAVSVPVHVETLSWSKTRQCYFDVLAQIEPRALWLLAPRLEGLNPGSTGSAIEEWIRGLRRYVRWAFIHLPNMQFDFSRLGQPRVTGFGLTIGPSVRAAAAPLDVLAAKAAKLVRICADQNAVACVDNVASLDELFLLKTSGVRMITGPVIQAAAEVPGPARPLSFAEVSPPVGAA